MSTSQPPPPPPPQPQDVEMPLAPPLPPSQPAPEQPQATSDPAPTSDDPLPSDQPPEQPSEPITPGPRAQRLRALFQQTAAHTLDKLNPQNFRECFPTIAKKAPGTLDNVHRQMIERLSTLWNREFERILETRQVIQKLNELEGLIQEAQQKRKEKGRTGGKAKAVVSGGGGNGEVPVPPHTLDAEVVLHAHLRGYLKEQEGRLGERLGEVQGENKKLFEEVLAQRKEMEMLISGVEKIVGDVKGASEVLGDVTGELENETREVDAELGRVGGGG